MPQGRPRARPLRAVLAHLTAAKVTRDARLVRFLPTSELANRTVDRAPRAAIRFIPRHRRIPATPDPNRRFSFRGPLTPALRAGRCSKKERRCNVCWQD
jgi:hypothetical protein